MGFATCIIFFIFYFVTPILNVPRKFSMRVIISTGYIKIYNLNYIQMNIIYNNHIHTTTKQYISSIHNEYILKGP
jgi:hypothetical protein